MKEAGMLGIVCAGQVGWVRIRSVKTLTRVLAVGFVVTGLAGCAESEPSGYDSVTAEVMCEQFVEQRLKSPASAEFSGQASKSLGGTKWEVTGTVDSQNSFGAMMRSAYTCTLKGPAAKDDDMWTAESVELDE